MIGQLTQARVCLAVFLALFLAGTAPSYAQSVGPGPVFDLTGIYDGATCNTLALSGYTIDNVGVVDGCRVLLGGKQFDVNGDGVNDFQINNAGSTNLARLEVIAGAGASGSDQVALRGATIVALTDISNAVIMDFKFMSPIGRTGNKNGYHSLTGSVQLLAKSETVVATGTAWGQLCGSCGSTPGTQFRDSSDQPTSLVDSTVGGLSISKTDSNDPFPNATIVNAFMRGTISLDRLSRNNRIAALGETVQIGNQPPTDPEPCTPNNEGVIGEVNGTLMICYVNEDGEANYLPGPDALGLATQECPPDTKCKTK